MGPYKNLSNTSSELGMQADEVSSLIYRVRQANRRLTGGCGEQVAVPTGAGRVDKVAYDEAPPLLVGLTVALERLNLAIAELRDEVVYLESVSETNQDTMVVRPGAPKGY